MMRRGFTRPDLDREAVRYFVYFLLDENGIPVYIGRSCNVANRIRAHTSDALHPDTPGRARKAEWLPLVRSVTMVGPFTWDDSVSRERAEIERHQPQGNIDLTARDRRPAVARRSARAAS